MASGVIFRPLPSPQPILNYVFAYRSKEASPELSHFLSLLKRSKPERGGLASYRENTPSYSANSTTYDRDT
jgi:hypothetical protein